MSSCACRRMCQRVTCRSSKRFGSSSSCTKQPEATWNSLALSLSLLFASSRHSTHKDHQRGQDNLAFWPHSKVENSKSHSQLVEEPTNTSSRVPHMIVSNMIVSIATNHPKSQPSTVQTSDPEDPLQLDGSLALIPTCFIWHVIFVATSWGSQDLFTTTGKWHFPDADDVQNQLFENIAWLFDKRLG